MFEYSTSTDYKIVLEREYYPLPIGKPTIALVMMVKNEKKRIHVSLESVLGTVDCMIIYDTGSTDNTKEIIISFCEKHRINLYMIEGVFINFSTSRNVLLDYADTKNAHYHLLLDTNDELRGGVELKKIAVQTFNDELSGYLVCQEWWSGNYDKYYNQRFIKAKQGWRYFGSVHEWIKDTLSNDSNPRHVPFKIPDNIVIYQDRTKDDDKSMRRFKRDKELLLAEHKENRTDARTLFYLAQTCSCLGEIEDAYYYYKLRSELDGFEEERFHSYLRCGDLALSNNNWFDAFNWWIKAYEHSNRVEPLVKIAENYAKKENWHSAYLYISIACELAYPENAILFVEKRYYEYVRWHLMAFIASHFMEKHVQGKAAAIKALEKSDDKKGDTEILRFYLNREEKGEIKVERRTAPGVLSSSEKDAFLKDAFLKLTKAHPGLPQKMIIQKAKTLWKKEKRRKR